MKSLFLSLVLLVAASVAPLRAQQEPAAEPAAASNIEAIREIEVLRENVLAAINANNMDKLLPLLAPNVVITFQNSEVARGRESVKKALQEATTGAGALVKSFRVEAKADDTPRFYGGQMAIIAGSSADSYLMANGKNLSLNERWTAVVVREGGQWQLAALQSSADLFNNPLVNSTKQAGTTMSVASLLIGLFAGWMIGRKRPISNLN